MPCQMQRKGMDPSLVTVIVKLIQHINIIPNKNSLTFLNSPLHYILLQNKSIIPQCLLMHAQHLLKLNLPASNRGVFLSIPRLCGKSLFLFPLHNPLHLNQMETYYIDLSASFTTFSSVSGSYRTSSACF
jgi:hypothetical protein